MSIVKTFFGTHLDLSKVVQISDASGWRDGSDFRVGFSIDVQLRDEPLRYSKVVDGKPGCVAELQERVDALVAQWKGERSNAESSVHPWELPSPKAEGEDEDDASSTR